MSKKLAFIVWSRGISGAAYRFARLISYMQSNGLDERYKIDFYLNRSLIEVAKDKNIKLHINDNVYILEDLSKEGCLRKLFLIFSAIRFFRIVKKYDSFHFACGGLLCLFPIKLAKLLCLAKPNLVVSSVSSNLWSESYMKFRSLIYIYPALLLANHIDCLNYTTTLRKHFPKKSISTAPNSFSDNDRYYYKGNYSDKENAVSYVGAFEDIKQPLLFLEAVKLIYKVNSSIKYYMIGSGTLLNTIVEIIDTFPANLKLKIHVGYSDNPIEFLNKTKVFLSLQKIDNYPSQALLEAMLAQNYVVATNYGDTHRLVNDDFACLLKSNAAHEIAETVLAFFSQSLSCQTLITAKAKEFIYANCTIEGFVKYFLSIHQLGDDVC